MDTTGTMTMTTLDKTFKSFEAMDRWISEIQLKTHPSFIRLIVNSDEADEALDPAEAFIKNIDKIAMDMGPEDLSEQHDHYLYGTPKR